MEEKIKRWEERGIRGSAPNLFCQNNEHQWKIKRTKRYSVYNKQHIPITMCFESTECIKCGAVKCDKEGDETSIILGVTCPELVQLAQKGK